MPLHDTETLILETATVAESLPDPTTVNGRMHLLAHTPPSSVVWSSVGATPFTVDGVADATLTVLRGTLRILQSDGVRWVVQPTAARRVFAAKGVSDGAGNTVFTFTPPFASIPVVSVGLETTNTNATEARITALSTSSCTVNTRQSPGVVILGISVLQVPQPLAGATVH